MSRTRDHFRESGQAGRSATPGPVFKKPMEKIPLRVVHHRLARSVTVFSSLRNFLGFQPKALCMVVSEQEDCEIWVNGKKTSYRTPRLIAIPKSQKVMIEIRQLGHEPHQAWVQTQDDLCFHYCELQKVPLRLVTQ